MSDEKVTIPSGMVCVTTYGTITAETVSALLALQRFNTENGLTAVDYPLVSGLLVDKARNDAVRTLLSTQHGWLLFLDADMTWPPDLLLRLIRTAYITHPHFDCVGGYANLRGDVGLPTMDTGTGTWEPHFPQSGVQEVMRTGGACLLVKRHVFERVAQPWFALRVPMSPIDAMREVDNFCRIKFNGKNPFRGLPGEFWERLEQCAVEDPSVHSFTPAEVGEDSGFCDRVRAAGLRIAVDTDVALGHVDKKITDWTTLKQALKRADDQRLLYCGVEP